MNELELWGHIVGAIISNPWPTLPQGIDSSKNGFLTPELVMQLARPYVMAIRAQMPATPALQALVGVQRCRRWWKPWTW